MDIEQSTLAKLYATRVRPQERGVSGRRSNSLAVIMNKYLQVEMRDGAVWGDGAFFAMGDCIFGCIDAPADWDKGGMHFLNINFPRQEGGCCAPKNLKPRIEPGELVDYGLAAEGGD